MSKIDPAASATKLPQFSGVFGQGTIEKFLTSSYGQFAAIDAIPNFLPLRAERFAKERLQALARVEGKSNEGRPIALSLCVHNAGRSQMAMGFFRHLAGEQPWPGPVGTSR